MQRSGTSVIVTVRSLLSRSSASASLYRGLAPAVFEVGVNRGALMGISTGIKQMLPPGLPEYASDATAGFAAGMAKTAVLHPLDTLTCRGQVGRTQLELIWPRPRFAELYSGMSPAIVRSAGGMAIWLSTRNGLERSTPESLQRMPWVRDWLVGMASTAITDLCTFPLDTLKKNLQADGGSLGELWRRLYRDGGPLRLYHGYGPRLLIMSVQGGLWNWVYVRVQEAQRSAPPR